MNGPDLAHIGGGMHDPVHGAQQAFRTLLDAFAAPGRVFTLPPASLAGIQPPADAQGQALPAGLLALLLTLLDRETPLRTHGRLHSDALAAWLRFHTGVGSASPAAFELLHADDLRAALLDGMATGSDEQPQLGATVIVLAAGFDRGPVLRLQGPGIADTATLQVAGVDTDAWAWRQQRQADYPRGLDLVFVCGDRLAALPRSTRITEIG